MATIATDQSAFDLAVNQAKPGDAILYHIGFLARDREGHENLALNVFARAVLRKFVEGTVHLVQRRLEKDRFEYLAIRSSKGHKLADDIAALSAA